MLTLPDKFTQTLRDLLPIEAEAFFAALEEDRVFGLRVNTLKAEPEFVPGALGLSERVPWNENGWYFDEEYAPSRHPYYHAGLYYIQEPSAMLTAGAVPIEPGDRVLDICAAPGGKTTDIAARLRGTGLLVANDISASRCNALVKNVELAGVTNCAVTNEPPRHLAMRFPEYFDKIIIDAPCSGEGMFRKDPSAAAAWTAHKPGACNAVQRELLSQCAGMLRPGGVMAYSTCTFNMDENERVVLSFLAENANFSPEPIDHARLGVSPGLEGLVTAARIFPHRQRGEGHFCLLLRKAGEAAPPRNEKSSKQPNVRPFREFCSHYCVSVNFGGEFQLWGESLYMTPHGLPLSGVKVKRPGLLLGSVRGDRFEPSFALAMALMKHWFGQTLDFPAESRAVADYLAGQSFETGAPDGWTLVCCDGFPLGFGKIKDGRMKNKRK